MAKFIKYIQVYGQSLQVSVIKGSEKYLQSGKVFAWKVLTSTNPAVTGLFQKLS